MGVVNRAFRNISRRKIRALLVIIALGFSLAIMISIPAGIAANQNATQSLTENLSNAIDQTKAQLNSTITQTQASINQTLTQIDCSLTPSAPQGFGFSRGNRTFNSGQFGGVPPDSNFIPGQFGGGFAPGEFGAGALGGQGGRNPMNETYYSDIANIAGVAAVAPVLQVSEGQNVTITTPFGMNFTRMSVEYIIEGITLTSDLVNTYLISPSNITAGRSLAAGDSGVVLLSENNSAYFGVGVGSTVSILGQGFQVIGIHGTSGVSDRLTLYMNLSDAQTLTNNTGYITTLKVFAENSADVTSIANAISALHAELDVTTAQQRLEQLQNLESIYQTQLQNAQSTYETQVQTAEATMNQTQTQAFQEIVVALTATSLTVLFVMLYTVRERTKEIGTLKAIGFSNLTVMSQFMLEGILLSLLAGVVAVVIGAVAAPFLSSVLLPTVNPFSTAGAFRLGVTAQTSTSAVVSVSPELMLMTFGVAVLLGAVGSLYPAWRAAKTRPAEAMRYE